jgi:hypothetical protein
MKSKSLLKYVMQLVAVTTFTSSLAWVELASAQQSDPCSYSCSNECRRYTEQLSRRLHQIQQTCGTPNPPNYPNPPTYPPNPGYPPAGGNVELYHSDSCSSSFVGNTNPYSSCSTFRGQSIWGVKYNGQCLNIEDADGEFVCQAFKSASDPSAVALYHSDSCSGSLVGFTSPYTNNCSLFAGKSIWGIKVNGQCINISDIDGNNACELFKAGVATSSIKLYHSDSCSSSLIATMNPYTVCEDLGRWTNEQVWGAMINGECKNIQDTDVVTACRLLRGYR